MAPSHARDPESGGTATRQRRRHGHGPADGDPSSICCGEPRSGPDDVPTTEPGLAVFQREQVFVRRRDELRAVERIEGSARLDRLAGEVGVRLLDPSGDTRRHTDLFSFRRPARFSNYADSADRLLLVAWFGWPPRWLFTMPGASIETTPSPGPAYDRVSFRYVRRCRSASAGRPSFSASDAALKCASAFSGSRRTAF